ncbi:hypothetical protein BDR22DRAFT_844811 [Usnea florida]
MVTTLMVGIVAVTVTGGGVGGEIVIGEGVGGVTVTVTVEGIVIAELTAVALRAVKTESRISFMLKLEDGGRFSSA